jgi:dCTP deaminase
MTTHPRQAIRELINIGVIQGVSSDNQLQPASLDLSLGDMAYKVTAAFLPRGDVKRQLAEFCTKSIGLDEPALLNRNCVYVIPLREKLSLPSHLCGACSPKSSIGRIGAHVSVICDAPASFDEIPFGYDGELYALVAPSTFPLTVRTGSRLAQLRVMDKTEPGYKSAIVLTADIWTIYRARNFTRQSTPDVDVDAVGVYPINRFWRKLTPTVDDCGRGHVILDPHRLHIMASQQRVELSSEQIANMDAANLSLGEFRAHDAGFFDPGFSGRAVAEVKVFGASMALRNGQPLGILRTEQMKHPADVGYGASALDSHYQEQTFLLSKHFSRET